MVEAWPHARNEFCCLVRHHVRATPTPRTSMTASYRSHPACKRLTTGGVSSKNLMTLERRRGLRFDLHVSVLTCHRPYSGFLTGAYSLYFSVSVGLPHRRRGSACIPPPAGFSRNRTLPAISVRSHFTKLHRSRYATACKFDEHPWPGTTHLSMSLRDTMSGQVRPRCYHLNPPSVYAPEREIGATVTFTLQET
jgi:hypothetical protein